MRIGILALAAGRARRFGSDKRLAPLENGRRCIEAFLEQVEGSGLPVLVCLAPGDDTLASLLAERDCAHAFCANAGAGMGSTLADGIARVSDWEGVLVALADMPWTAASTYRTVAASLRAGRICVPVFAGRRGHPVGFSRHFFTGLAKLSGDTGGRDLLQKHADRIDETAVTDAAILEDIDVPEHIISGGRSP